MSLFHPKRIVVRYGTSVEALMKNPKGIARINNPEFVIALSGDGINVNGQFASSFDCAGGSEFEVEIPGKIKRSYSGQLKVAKSRDNIELVIIITTSLESVVPSVVLSEMGEDAPAEARRSLSVAARSYAIAHAGRHSKEGYDLCDTTHCVFYRGMDGGDILAQVGHELRSVENVALVYKGKVVPGYYHAVCGGKTHTPSEVWGRQPGPPYKSVACVYCIEAERFRWSNRIEKDKLASALSIPIGSAWSLSTSGLGAIEVSTGGAGRLYKNEAFRMIVGRELGYNLIPSPWFQVREVNSHYEFTGRGFGHTVGLCESGAMKMAKLGKRWRDIVSFYFPKFEISDGN